MRMRMLDALPPFFGGKRKLLGEIFKMLPPPSEAPVFVDPFLGGGSVGLFAKAKGHRVLASDNSHRSFAVARALIQNDRVKIQAEDLARLFKENEKARRLVQDNFCPDVFTRNHACFLDLALANLDQCFGTKEWLMKLLLIKYIFYIRPHGNFGAKSIVHQLEKGEWESINVNYATQALNERINSAPYSICKKLAARINQGVFGNGQRNEAFRFDAIWFLKNKTWKGSIAYFDPPYAGTQAYESSLKVVDSIVEGRLIRPQRSIFSGKRAREALENMFEAAKHIPVWCLSYGNAVIGLQELEAMMKKFKKKVKAKEIQYAHCEGLASKESKERNREFIITGSN